MAAISCVGVKDPRIVSSDNKILLEERLIFYPQEMESGDSILYSFEWLPFGSSAMVDSTKKVVAAFGYTNDYEIVLIQDDSVQQLVQNVVNVERTFLLEGGKKLPCIAYKMALDGPWCVIRYDGKPIADVSDKLYSFPRSIKFVKGESNMVVTDSDGNSKTVLR